MNSLYSPEDRSFQSTSMAPDAKSVVKVKWIDTWLVDFVLFSALSLLVVGRLATGRYFSFEEDTLLFYVPLRHLLTDPQVGFWDPYQFCGFPLDANPQAQLFYPPNVLFHVLDTGLAYGLLLWFHISIGGVSVSYLLRNLNASVTARRFGGVVFLFSTFWQSKITNAGMLAGSAWVGFALGAAVQAFRADDREQWLRGIEIAALALALSVMGGMPHPPLLSVTGMVFLALERIVNDPHRWKPIVLRLFSIGLMASLLSAVTWLPALEFLPRSHRQPLDMETAMSGALTPLELLGAVFGGISQTYIARLDPWEGTAVVSSPALMLAVVGFVVTKRTCWSWAVMIIMALIVSAGSHLFLAAWLWSLIPGLDRFNLPNRSLLLVVLGFSVYAGLGLDGLKTYSGRTVKRFWLGCGWGFMLLSALLMLLWPGTRYAILQTDFTGNFFPEMPSDWQWSVVWNLLWGGLAALTVRVWYSEKNVRSCVPYFILVIVVIYPQLAFQPRLFLESISKSYYSEPATAAWLRENLGADRYLDFRPAITSASHVDSPLVVPHLMHRLPEWYRLPSAYGYDPLYPLDYGEIMHTAGGTGRQSGIERNVRMARLPAHVLRRFGIRYIIGDPYERMVDVYDLQLRGNRSEPLNFQDLYPIDRLWLRHHLREGPLIPQGQTVGQVTIITGEGERKEYPIRVGIEVANALLKEADKPARHRAIKLARWWTIPMAGYRTSLQQYATEWRFDPPHTIKQIMYTSRLPSGVSWNILEQAISLSNEGPYRLVYRMGDAEIYEVTDALRTVEPVCSIAIVPHRQAALERIIAPESDPYEMIVTEGDAKAEVFKRAALHSAEILGIQRGQDRLNISYRAGGSAVLRIVEGWSPWWHPTVNGQQVPIIRADLAFMAALVPEGEGVLELEYRPIPMYCGMLLSGIGILTWLGIFIGLLRGMKQ